MFLSLGQVIQSVAKPAAQPTTLDTVDKGLKIIAVVLGGIWTYLNYVRGRTFKRRLEPKIAGRIAPGVDPGSWMVFGTAQVKNVGLSKVDIEATGTAIVIDDIVPGTSKTGVALLAEREILGGVLDVFDRHRWIEPGETIEESFAAPLPNRDDRAALKLRLRIVSRHKFLKSIEWNADAIAESPTPPPDPCSSTAALPASATKA